MEREVRMTIGEHLDELRMRVIRCLVAIVLACVVCYVFREEILQLVTRPVNEAQDKAAQYRKQQRLAENPEEPPESGTLDLEKKLIVPSVEGAFLIHLKVVIYAAIFFSSPFCLYQLWSFVSAGLYSNEKKYVYRFAPFSIGLFMVGVVLCYLYMLPLALFFLLTFSSDIVPLLQADKAVSFVSTLLLAMGVVFETPLVMLFLSYIGVGTAPFFTHYRRHFILIAAIVSAVLTPQDLGTMIMMGVPLVVLYEVGIILVRIAGKKVKAE